MTTDCGEQAVPANVFQGTYLNSKIISIDDVVQRIAYELGAPLITLEVHQNAIYSFVTMAIERFTKFAGYTNEYLVFNSCLYEPSKGIKLDALFSLTPGINSTYSGGLSSLAYDYDLADYRKVIDVSNFEEGQSSGINTLFTIEQSLAQQTYFAYSQGNYGFDLTSWYCMKEWLKLREKVLATLIDWNFNQDTQYLRLIPEPQQSQPYWGIVKCSVEKSIKDLVKEPWIQDYTLALTKISLARTRGKFNNTQLFGGGSVEWNTLLAEGIQEKKDLEDKLLTGTTAGWGDSFPVDFFIG